MLHNIIIPSPGESITEVEMGRWLVEEGAIVAIDQEIAEVESDKATLPLLAPVAGKVSRLIAEGDVIEVGGNAATIDDQFAEAATSPNAKEEIKIEHPSEEKNETETVSVKKAPQTIKPKENVSKPEHDQIKITPIAQAMMEENNLSIEDVLNGLQRITKKEIAQVIEIKDLPAEKPLAISRESERKAMTPLRKKLSERLVQVKNETAMLTTFNEMDMSAVMDLRKKNQAAFVEKHGLKLGFMSLFTKAVSEALKLHPMVNAMMDGDEIVQPKYHDVGIAVSSEKGLMVPVVRNVETKSIPTIEKEIKALAIKVRSKRLKLEEMTGGTFTITNGGVFGSMMSTPIINPPQSGILGMHNIVERPVAINGKVEIRPIMYIALSYDHRIIDGKDSVGFLKKVKEFIESPETLFTGNQVQKKMLDL